MAPPDKAQEEARAASRTRDPSRAIHARLAAAFGDAVELVDAVDPYTVVQDPGRFLEVMQHLRDSPDLAFDFLRAVTGVDYPEERRIASVYHLFSYVHRHAHAVKLFCEREAPEAPTVAHLWPSAGWFEREAYDLLGIVYVGHWDLRRILLPDDWIGHPLRKDYVEQAEYHGIGTTRPSPLDAFAAMDEARRAARTARGEAAPAVIPSTVKPPADWVPPRRKSSITAPPPEEEKKA